MAHRCRAVAVTEGGGTRLVEAMVPAPGAGELLLAVSACGLCGTDLFKLQTASVPAGTVLGHELVGTVVAAGAGAAQPVGARVVATHHVPCGTCPLCRRGAETQCAVFKENLLVPGGFSELVLVRRRAAEGAAFVVPEEVADAAAVFLEPAACVLRGIWRAELAADGTAVVLGGGSMGLLHLLVLRAALPRVRVLVSDPLAERRELALGLGATAAASPEALQPEVERVTGGLGADAVFDTVGGSGPLGGGLACLRPGGTVVLFAHGGPGEAAGFELNPFFKREARVVATYSGAPAEQRAIAELLLAGRLDPSPLITHRLPLERFGEAVELARRRQALKVLLLPGAV